MSKRSNPELRKEWERRISIYRSSGQTQARWCAANDISIHQFKYWLNRIEGSKSKTVSGNQWIPVDLIESNNEDKNAEITNIEVLHVTIGLASIEVKPGFNPTLLKDVVKVLNTLC